MNGIDKISARILSDAQAEAGAIRAQAEEKAAAITAEYDKKVSAAREKTALEAENEAQKQLERAQGAVRMATRRQVLEQKQALVDETFRAAEQTLCSLPENEYTALCAHLASDASVTGTEQLIFSEADRARVGEAACKLANELLQKAGKQASLTLSDETRPLRGGVVLKDGLIETNCSLGVLVDGLRPELSGKVAACLFG